MTRRKRNRKRRYLYRAAYGLLLGVAAVALLPVIAVVFRSFSVPEAFFPENAETVQLIPVPYPFSLRQYAAVFEGGDLLFFWNSVKLTVPILAGGMLFAVLSGYGLAKFSFPCKKLLLFVYILAMLLPIQVNVVGTYLFFDRIGLTGNRLGVILPGMFSSFGAFLMYQFMRVIPDETLEGARIDGAGEIRILLQIAVPQVKSGIASLLILLLIDCWNMVEMPASILREEELYPLAFMLRTIGEADPKLISAVTVLFCIPVLLVFFLAQEELTEGIQRSGELKIDTLKR